MAVSTRVSIAIENTCQHYECLTCAVLTNGKTSEHKIELTSKLSEKQGVPKEHDTFILFDLTIVTPSQHLF